MNTVSPETTGRRTAKLSTAARIALDTILILVLITLYSKNAVSLLFHEIVGLLLFCLFFLHLIFNRKWIANLLHGKVVKASKAKVMTAVNVLLMTSWLSVLVTGILVSKKVFSLQISSLNPIHFFSAALALILTGIHFGLHWQYYWGFLNKRIRIPRAVAVTLTIIILAFGCLQTVNSSFGRWLTAPFTSNGEEHGSRNQAETADMPEYTSDRDAENSNDDTPDNAENPSVEGSAESAKSLDGMPPVGEGQHGQQPFSILNLLNIIATYFSIVFLFAAIARGIELLIRKIHAKAHCVE